MTTGMIAIMNSVYSGKTNGSAGQYENTFTGSSYYLLQEQSVPSFLG